MLKNCSINITQNSPPNRRISKLSTQQESFQQLELFPLIKKRQKPQIASIPGISLKVRDRYRVILGDRILGDRLTIEQALQLTGNTSVLNSSNNLKSR